MTSINEVKSSSSSRKKTWERRLDEAKRKHRPKLKNWSRDGFATTRKEDFLKTRTLDDDVGNLTKLRISKVNVKSCSSESFIKYFEEPYQPCIITGVPQEEGWKAPKEWTFDKLKRKYKNRPFKVGEDDDGYKVKLKMKYFLKYLQNNSDDSPLYIFDGNYDEDSTSKDLLQDYQKPSYFRDDLFSLVGEKKRPPYRWFLVGPERSGSTIHIDPLGTSAWNTVIQGRKRWVLFPPGTPKAVVKGLEVIQKGEDDESINYFVDLLPRIKAKYGPELEIMEYIQEAGETIYVPGGWWHGVLNLTDTIAITQNFCSYTNFDAVWKCTRSGRKKMSVRWLRELQTHHPTLYRRAVQLNQRDGFEMYSKETDPKRGGKAKKDTTSQDETTVSSSSSSSSDKRKADQMSAGAAAVVTPSQSCASLSESGETGVVSGKKQRQVL